MQKGKIGVSSDNLFPIIKKFLYSDHEIFLREIVSNAVDATQKLKTLASVGEYKGELGDLTIRVSIDKKKKTLTVSDAGVGMTSEEIDKYINQIAFSGANEFVEKYKNDAQAIIGHFGLGFYSSFMVSKKVEVITRSYKDEAEGVKWECDGSPEFELTNVKKERRGTDIIMYIDDDNKEFLEDYRVEELLKKYCKFLPVEIAFGKKKEWKEDKQVDTDEDNIINDTKPAWTKAPADLKDEDYLKFYKQLYPMADDPLFNIHLNVDYPFNLTGILYFPKLKKNIEVQKNKIQLYSNQVFVTDSVEGVVPEFLTLLHGVIDSPDIPLNVSRSYLQSDSNVKKISSHITKKVADRLNEIFKNDRKQFEEKWDDLKIFIEYGMITEEKFYERAEKFVLLKNTEGKYFTLEEYKNIIKDNQTDKDKQLVYLYATDVDAQFTFIEAAKNKGYDVLQMDGQLDSHFINHLESKLKDSRFVRVDGDVVEKLIPKDEKQEMKLSEGDRLDLTPVFHGQLPQRGKANFLVTFEAMSENDSPVLITQNEFMRRMKDMAEMQGGMSFYGDMPDNYNLVINANHPLVMRINEDKEKDLEKDLKGMKSKISTLDKRRAELEKAKEGKKDEEVPSAEKEELHDVSNKLDELKKKKETLLNEYGQKNKLVKQLIDLALLSNNMLKGEDLNKFVKRSIELI
ncbi:molecular chaperone HtpG [Saccharicrinis sp. FJH54]|uniref:molecular chaperone HtpG n=1 Tax=Saccharicrinis sp. FJH54 TaxID=3344665 RepID=UPI0035D3F3EF